MRCTSHSKLRYISHLFSQCDVRRIGLWGVVVQTIPNKLPELLINLSSQGPHLMGATVSTLLRQTDGGSGRRSRPKRPPQRIGREGEQLRGTARRERHRQAMAATRRCHRLLLQEVVTTPVTHAPLAARLGSRRISSKEDTGTNPSIILHITGRTKPIFQL